MAKQRNFYKGFDFVSKHFQRTIKTWLSKHNQSLPIQYMMLKLNNKNAILRLHGVRYVYVNIRNYQTNYIECELVVSFKNNGMSYDFEDALTPHEAEPRLRFDGSYVCQMCNDNSAGSSEIYSDIDDLLNRHVLDGLRAISDGLIGKPYLHYRLDKYGWMQHSYLHEVNEPLRPNYEVANTKSKP
ncbi:hypothetical protein [Vibrio halioticoli]|nr:hypothetical protein [Vibrio halioticoli]